MSAHKALSLQRFGVSIKFGLFQPADDAPAPAKPGEIKATGFAGR
jgi:hypothetical protein